MLKPQISLTLGGQSSNRKNDTTNDSKGVDWEMLGVKAAVIQQSTETVAKVVIGAYAAKKLIDTVSEIAVIAAQAKLK